MGHKKRTYKIRVDMAADPPVQLLKEDGRVAQRTERLVFNKDNDGMRKVDHYRIRFEIDDFANSPLRFVRNEKDVFWVKEGEVEDCPTSFCELPGIIWVDNVHSGGKWIDVINMNMTKLDFQFTLNFCHKTVADPRPDDYIPLDPPGGNENGGGTGSGLALNAFAVLAAGFAFGLVAFFGARLFFTGW